MMKNLLLFAVCLSCMSVACTKDPSAEDNKPVQPVPADPESYNVTVKVDHEISGDIFNFVSILPIPESNEYQTVENLSCPDGKVKALKGSDNKCNYIEAPEVDFTELSHSLSYDVTLHPFRTDFSKITTIYDYDPSSEECVLYLGRKSVIIDPGEAFIKLIGDKMWKDADDIIDYARLCYEYVAYNFIYQDSDEDIVGIGYIRDTEKGDCGTLSSVFISLLRYKGIPSRHVAAVRTNGATHVWAEFYLEKYGWIPVDVTKKSLDRSGDYFGYYGGDAIVVSKDVCYEYEYDIADPYPEPRMMYCLQTYLSLGMTEKGGKVTSEFSIKAKLIE